MSRPRLTDLPVWKKLERHAEIMSRPENHLRILAGEKERLPRFSRNGGGLFFDFSRQRLDDTAFDLLAELAAERRLFERFGGMVSGGKVNATEGRAALHTAARRFSSEPVEVDGKDVMPEIRRVRGEIRRFSESVRSGDLRGSSGKPFRDVVVIGIGGSYLGPEFVSSALAAFSDERIRLHYLSNVDIHNFGEIAARIDAESTLWIVVSKSYTTPETSANETQALSFLSEKGIDASRHFVTVTSKGSPGDDPTHPVLAVFHMFDFIGGRYSATSAVGGVPLSLFLGYEMFERFLKGAEEMDRHAETAPVRENIPLLAALIAVWNNNFLCYPAHAIIPYASPLSRLAPHIQQLNMESNGKSVTVSGEPLPVPAGQIIFGEPGTNAQHSFFQLAHQGRGFPIDFIGVIHPQYTGYNAESKGVTNHQELWANLLSQPAALARGKDDPDPARSFPGNRPSSTILMRDLSPENIGRLLSFYEAKTVFEAFVWDINPFDQFGVELGKIMAADIRKEIAKKNRDPKHAFDKADPIAKFYLEKLFSGEI